MQESTRRIMTFVLAGLLVFGLSTAFAETPGPEAQEETAAPAAGADEAAIQPANEHVTVPFAGMQIAVDPETGRLRPPTAVEAAKLAAGMRKMFGKPVHSKSGPQVTEHADGMLSAVIAPDLIRYSVLHINEDGSRTQECLKSPGGLEALIETTNPSSDEQ